MPRGPARIGLAPLARVFWNATRSRRRDLRDQLLLMEERIRSVVERRDGCRVGPSAARIASRYSRHSPYLILLR